jgi:CheY-like chemotaxis protein
VHVAATTTRGCERCVHPLRYRMTSSAGDVGRTCKGHASWLEMEMERGAPMKAEQLVCPHCHQSVRDAGVVKGETDRLTKPFKLEDPGMARELILVVEDDPDLVELFRCALHDAGYEVATADAGAALPLAHERQPRVILLDLLMPGMDGVQMSRHLRADPATAQIPIIALSATPQWLPDLPVSDRLTKPFRLGHLLAKVRYWVRASSGRRIHWREAGERIYAFDRTTGRVVASCMHGIGTRWWVVLRDSTVIHGPFDTLEEARSETEQYLLA